MRERLLHWLLGNTNPKERWIFRKSRDIYLIRDRLASVEGRIHAISDRIQTLEHRSKISKDVSCEVHEWLASIEGRLYAAENSASAANSRAERLETRLRSLEGRLELMDAAPPPLPREGAYHE